MCIQQMGQRAILAVGSWNLPSVVYIRLLLKSIKGNFHTQFSTENKIWERLAGLSPMGIRVAVGKSFVWWHIVTDRLMSWSRVMQDWVVHTLWTVAGLPGLREGCSWANYSPSFFGISLDEFFFFGDDFLKSSLFFSVPSLSFFKY